MIPLMTTRPNESFASAPTTAPATGQLSRHVWLRVPQVIVLFWVIKVLTTGMGETLSDFLGTHLPLPLAGGCVEIEKAPQGHRHQKPENLPTKDKNMNSAKLYWAGTLVKSCTT